MTKNIAQLFIKSIDELRFIFLYLWQKNFAPINPFSNLGYKPLNSKFTIIFSLHH